MVDRRVGLLGASSMVGSFLLPQLTQAGWLVAAFSRRNPTASDAGVTWRVLDLALPQGDGKIEYWICIAPIWALSQYFDMMEAHGARRVVALSSTSLFTKGDSTDSSEKAVAAGLAMGEETLRIWGEVKGVEWVVLRPTLIYGHGRDQNIVEMGSFICRFGFFPLLGLAGGLRQPVYVEDVAAACVAALSSQECKNRAYNIAGGETLSYRDMAGRVFAALGRRPRLITTPQWLFSVALAFLHLWPRYHHWTIAMAERMNHDLVFDHADAKRDFGYTPRTFRLDAGDLTQ